VTDRPPLPVGFRLTFDEQTRVLHGSAVVVGGAPRRALRLTARGAGVVDRLRGGAPVTDPVDGALARRLVDAGMAHPAPDPDGPTPPVAVVVPAKDRVDDLDRCLTALDDAGFDVVVVDDASDDREAVERIACSHGARVVRRERNAGPAAARNTGLAATETALVAFVDSDAVIDAAAIRSLAAHLADPDAAATAPRVRPQPVAADSLLARFAAVRSPLDMGARSTSVGSGEVGYVPSTVLVVRRDDVEAVGGFAESMRWGEDVDLVWRLVDAGRSVRYCADVTATHREPMSWPEWLRRRHRYGTSAGALARRHPGRMRGPSLAGFVAPLSVLRALPRLRAADLPATEVVGPAMAAPLHALSGLSRWAMPLWWPLPVLGLLHRRSRPVAAVALAVPPLLDRRHRRADLDPVRYVVAALADDVAYGTGVWRGCLRARTPQPLLPRVRRVNVSRRRSVP
jgi:mycofactocin glycosyltransferase